MLNPLKKRILAARKEIPADLVLKGGKVINVFSGEILERDVALLDNYIVGLGADYQGREIIDLRGKWIVPGLIDGHIHIESSMLTPSRLSEALLVHGTTTIIADPHEIGNVMGLSGVRYMLKTSRDIPFDVFFMAPSCVPATHLETAGAVLNASDLAALKNEPRVLGLAEMMNFPGVIAGDHQVLEKIELFSDKILDGHCPALTKYDLQAYISAGIRSDHEITDISEGLEKMENGMMVMIREGTSAKNLEELVPLVNDRNARRFCFVSDDLHAEDILERGHLNFIVKKAVALGLPLVTAIQMVTLNPAEYFGLKDRGAVAPGYLADLVILDDLETLKVNSVLKDGDLVVKEGVVSAYPVKTKEADSMGPRKALNTAPLDLSAFRIPHAGTKARIIELIPEQLLTRACYEEVKSSGGRVMTDVESDILKLAVVERHHASGRVGLGLVRGFGLKRGAIASSVAHDSHNIIAAGVSDRDILKAVDAVRIMGGGLAVVDNNEVLAKTPLEIAGLMSGESLDSLVDHLKEVKKAASALDSVLKEPFMALSFLALPVIPELKLTDRGLVDVNSFEIVSLFVD